MNNCNFIGYVCEKPEMKTTQSGKQVTEFAIGIQKRNATGESGWDNITLICWEKKAEFASKYLDKGCKVAVTCEVVTSVYADKEGQKRRSVKFNVNNIEFCEKKSATQEHQQAAEQASEHRGTVQTIAQADTTPTYMPDAYLPKDGKQQFNDSEEELPF